MKMVKSLLLGSATALVALAGAQAADLPVKAKPVQYVKICSQYGLGYFYIPGTDTCIKLGGAVRMQAEYGATNGGIPFGFGGPTTVGTTPPGVAGNQAVEGLNNRTNTSDINFRNRIFFSFDTRQQTEYGTLRTYARFGIQQQTATDTVAGSTFFDRAMIQFAGFTFGRTVSYFDAITLADFHYQNNRVFRDSGAAGVTVVAYTAQFGNGVSATISAEDPNAFRGGVVDTAGAGGNVFATTPVAGTFAYDQTGASPQGMRYPDIVGNIRVDQAWGSAQIMGALHDAGGQYYTAPPTFTCVANTTSCGHPGDRVGWAVGGGLSINLPGWGATGIANSQPNVDQFRLNVAYGEGATGFVTSSTGYSTLFNGVGRNGLGLGLFNDGTFGNGTGVELTKVFAVIAAYQHLWTPTLRTSVYGGYTRSDFTSFATSLLCGGTGATGGTVGCNPDTAIWNVGTRTQWNPVSQLDLGIDVVYTRLETATPGGPGTFTGVLGAQNLAGVPVNDQSMISVLGRVQRNFWP